MLQAKWNGATLAESDRTIEVEGNQYFPPDSLSRDYFVDSAHTSTCPWKGRASYYSIVVGDATNQDAAWYYADPSPAAESIRGYVSFWHGVRVQRSDAAVALR